MKPTTLFSTPDTFPDYAERITLAIRQAELLVKNNGATSHINYVYPDEVTTEGHRIPEGKVVRITVDYINRDAEELTQYD